MAGQFLNAFIAGVELLRGQPWALPVFLVGAALSCQGLPTTIFPVVGGILFGFWGGLFANAAGFVLGSLLTFLVSRRWGSKLWARWRSQPLPTVFRRPNFWLLLVVRLTGFPPLMMTNLLAGLSEMSVPVFLGATAVGVLPWCAMMSFFADVLWDALRAGGFAGFKATLMAYAKPLMLAGATFGALVALAAWFGRRLLPPQDAGSVKE